MKTDAKRVERMIREIQQDMAEGRVPQDCPTFSALHDTVDANEYGGFTDDDPDAPEWDDLVDQANRCQNFVDAWLRAGQPDLVRAMPSGEHAAIWPIEGSRAVQVVFWGSEADYATDWAAYETADWSDNATCSVAVDTLGEALAEIND